MTRYAAFARVLAAGTLAAAMLVSQATESDAQARRRCPQRMPRFNSPCREIDEACGYAANRRRVPDSANPSWYCSCEPDGPNGPMQWQCSQRGRAVPGPLAPPELGEGSSVAA